MIAYFFLLEIINNINSYLAGCRISSFYNSDTNYIYFVQLIMHAIIGAYIIYLQYYIQYYYIDLLYDKHIKSITTTLSNNILIYKYCRHYTLLHNYIVNIVISLISISLFYTLKADIFCILALSIFYNMMAYILYLYPYKTQLIKYSNHIILFNNMKTNSYSIISIYSNLKHYETIINTFLFVGAYSCSLLAYLYIHLNRNYMDQAALSYNVYKFMFIQGKCNLISKIIKQIIKYQAYSNILDKLALKKETKLRVNLLQKIIRLIII